jgi:hypothetical protein
MVDGRQQSDCDACDRSLFACDAVMHAQAMSALRPEDNWAGLQHVRFVPTR